MAKKDPKNTTKRLRTSYLSSVISTALVLFLLGVVGLLVFNANRLANHLKDNVTLSINMKDGINEKEAMRFMAQIERQPYVRAAQYKSKEEAAREIQQELGTDFLTILDSNPLPISIDIKLSSVYFSTDSATAVKQRLMKFPEVKDVVYQKSLLDAVSRNVPKLSTIILLFVVLLLFVSLFLINNTIRLAIYSKRFLINTMKLVGANSTFIRTPFLAASVWQGLLSGFIAILLLIGLIFLLRKDFSEFLELADASMFAVLFSGILILGSLISFLSTYVIVTKYTRISADDLYY